MKVTAGDAQLTGVALLNPANHVLTTSITLGAGPLVSVRTDSGQTFSGWIVGRDDGKDLALVRVIGATLPGVKYGDSLGVSIGAEVLSIGYPVARPGSSVPLEGQVSAVRTDFATGVRFLRVNLPPLAGTVGSPLFNRNGELLGINVENSYIQSLGLPASDDSFAKAEDSIRPAIEALAGGSISLTAPRPTPAANPASPPPFPMLVKGTATAGGTALPAGTTVYARLFGQNLMDLWFTDVVGADGAVEFTIGVINPIYTSGKVEFYHEGVKSGTVLNYQGQLVETTLSFP